MEHEVEDAHLEKDLKRDLEEFLRNRAKKLLAERRSLTLGQIAKLVAHPEQGEVVQQITLGDLFDYHAAQHEAPGEEALTTEQAGPLRKRARAPKRKRAISVADGEGTSSEGRSRPRLDYDTGCKEVLAAVIAAGAPVSRSDLETATDYNSTHLRAYLKKLIADEKINVVGNGGRSTRYEAV